MYRAKESGRNAFQFFASDMNIAALERLVLENRLRQGLERGEFILHYQPQINVATGRIVGAEALIRWQHPEIGMVSPGKFIPVAELSGLIGPLCNSAAAGLKKVFAKSSPKPGCLPSVSNSN